MTDIPEGLVEAVANAINDESPTNGMWLPYEDLPDVLQVLYRNYARAAILAQNAWQDDLNRRMVEFVEFRGENPRGR